MTLIPCPACKAEVSRDAVACPKCGHPFQKPPKPNDDASRKAAENAKGLGCLALIIIAVLFYWYRQKEEKDKASLMPPQQASFAKLMEQYRELYDKAINPIKKTELRRQRASAIQTSLPSLKVENWIGTVSYFDLTPFVENENVGLRVSVPDSHLSIATTSAWFKSTKIAKGSPLYAVISELKVGDMISFSGEFRVSGAVDYLDEASVTESGSMNDPCFFFAFSSIHKLSAKNQPANPGQQPQQQGKKEEDAKGVVFGRILPGSAKIGDEVSFNNNSTWVVLSAENKGNTLKQNNHKPLQWEFLTAEIKEKFLKSSKKNAETSGKFIVVRYRVCNLIKELEISGTVLPKQTFETRILDGPVLIDSQGRKFKSYDGEPFYIPEGAETILLKALPSGLPREFYAVFEVPADAKGLRFRTRDLGLIPDYKLVDLGF